jgi:acyl carrier protein
METVVNGQRDLLTELSGLATEMIDWETALSGPPTRETLLVHDLGFQSLDVVMLILAIEGHFERRGLPFDQLLVDGDQYVSDLSLGQIADFLEDHLGAHDAGSAGRA